MTRKQADEILAFDAKARTHAGTLRYNYIETDGDDVTVVHVAVRRRKGKSPEVKDVCRWHIATGRCEMRDMECLPIAGWRVLWDGDGRWRRWRAKWTFGDGATFPWFGTVNVEALKGTRHEWCQYADDVPVGLVDWLTLHRKEPKVELLAKAGLWRLIRPAGIAALKDARVRGWVTAHREEIAKGEGIDVSDVLYAARHGVTLQDAKMRLRFARSMQRRFGRVRCMAKGLRPDYGRLMAAMPRWDVDGWEYARYLEAAHECGLDLRNEGTLYPPVRGGRKAFMERLEGLEREVARRRRAEERRQRKEARERQRAEERWIAETARARAREMAAFEEAARRSVAGGYRLVVARTQKELLAEGRRMGNCVGNGIYGKGIATGERLIVMLRKTRGHGGPGLTIEKDGHGGPGATIKKTECFCDIEIDRRDWSVRQCYLKRNQPAPGEVWALAKRIAAAIKAERRRQRKAGMFRELERRTA